MLRQDNTMSVDPGCNEVAGGEVRTLHPLAISAGATGEADIPGDFCGLAIDVETTGLVAGRAKIIELAMRQFRYDREGMITEIYEPHCWREDPGEPISPAITLITGLTNEDVAGCRIDHAKAVSLMKSVSFIVAHCSSFDRKFVEARFPDAAGLAWTCSLEQVDWRKRGMGNMSLGFLLHECGYYHLGHRAEADVDALLQILRHKDSDGRTALAEMIERGDAPGWKVNAIGAAFDVKDELKERGYRWNAAARYWSIELPDEQTLGSEQIWLNKNVYALGRGARARGPEVEQITAHTRFL